MEPGAAAQKIDRELAGVAGLLPVSAFDALRAQCALDLETAFRRFSRSQEAAALDCGAESCSLFQMARRRRLRGLIKSEFAWTE